jgi:hypothetical protein
MNTARKVANVLLVLPEDDGSHGEIRKLRDVGELDQSVFGAHQDAIKAVEDMYRSMWRLAVYVAPEYLDRWEEISRVAGQVIFREFDAAENFPDQEWQNDRHLIRELTQKYGGNESVSSDTGVRLPEVDKLIAAGLIDSNLVHEKLDKALRPNAILSILLPAIGKEHLEKREEKLFNDFVEENVLNVESDRFVGWLGNVKASFVPPQAQLPLDATRHFKAGDITTVIERLKTSLRDFKD